MMGSNLVDFVIKLWSVGKKPGYLSKQNKDKYSSHLYWIPHAISCGLNQKFEFEITVGRSWISIDSLCTKLLACKMSWVMMQTILFIIYAINMLICCNVKSPSYKNFGKSSWEISCQTEWLSRCNLACVLFRSSWQWLGFIIEVKVLSAVFKCKLMT